MVQQLRCSPSCSWEANFLDGKKKILSDLDTGISALRVLEEIKDLLNKQDLSAENQ